MGLTQPPIHALPLETISIIFDNCLSLHDLLALASSCKRFNSILQIAGCRHHDLILRRTLPACDDALRVQRASVAAMQHLRRLGFDDGDQFQPMLPPKGTPPGPPLALCRFDQDQGEFVNVPAEEDIIKLGETPVASLWEAQRLMQLHKVVLFHRNLAGSPANFHHEWFHAAPEGCDWVPDQEERFFRGAYRYWLYCYLFYPGCYLEPVFLEREELRRWLDGTLNSEIDEMARYPLFIPHSNWKTRQQQVEFLFDGFITWLVHDGEQRGERERFPKTSAPSSIDPFRSSPCDVCSTPATHGAKRELLLIHSMSRFFEGTSRDRYRKSAYNRLSSVARFPVFDLCSIYVWQVGMNGEALELQTFNLGWHLNAPTPARVIARIRNPDGSLNCSVGWPELEAVIIGLRKLYNLELHGDLDTFWRPYYSAAGGAVLDIFPCSVAPLGGQKKWHTFLSATFVGPWYSFSEIGDGDQQPN